MKIKKLLSLILFLGIFLGIGAININATSSDGEPEWYLTQRDSGIPIMNILFYPRQEEDRLVSFELLDYGVAYAYESFEDPNYYSEVKAYNLSGTLIFRMTLTEFQAYTNMLSLQIQGIYTVNFDDLYLDGHLQYGAKPEDIATVRFNIVYFHETTQTQAETYLSMLNNDGINYSYEFEKIRLVFRNYDNWILYDEYLDASSLDYEPNITDYPIPPNSYVRYVFRGWTYENGISVDFYNLNNDYLVNGYLPLFASYNLVNALTGDIEGDITPATEGRIPVLFNTLGLDSIAGYIMVYLILIIIAVITCLKFNLGNSATLIILIIITGLFNYFGFLPLLISVLIYLALGVLLLYANKGGGSSE